MKVITTPLSLCSILLKIGKRGKVSLKNNEIDPELVSQATVRGVLQRY